MFTSSFEAFLMVLAVRFRYQEIVAIRTIDDSAGNRIECTTPGGTRRLEVEDMLHQPETATA